MSTQIVTTMSELGVMLSPTAGEAHWQLGITERSIGTIFSIAERIFRETRQHLEFPEAVRQSLQAHSQVERVRGYSPAQWAIGRQPSWTEGLHDEDPDVVNLSQEGHSAFHEKMKIQMQARAIAEEELLKGRIQRAEHAKRRRDRIFCPGDTVFAWRVGMEKNKGQ